MKIKAKALIGKKVGMTRVYDDKGQMIPVTLLEIPNLKVTKVLTPERDGYHGFQLGYYEKREVLLTKPDITRLRKASVTENFSRFKEFRIDSPIPEIVLGKALSAKEFEGVSSVDVMGLTRGQGFQGAVKRWGASIGRKSHGSDFHRRPGSLGMRSTPARVFKNKPMPGRLGGERTTVLNLSVVEVDIENNLIAVKGSVPGNSGSFVALRPSIKIKA
jgi:large subunit ribosomal protein L3